MRLFPRRTDTGCPTVPAERGQELAKNVVRAPVTTVKQETQPTFGVMSDPQYEQQERLIVSLLDQIAGHIRENSGLWDQLKKDAETIDAKDQRIAELELTVKALGTQLAGWSKQFAGDRYGSLDADTLADGLLTDGWAADLTGVRQT